MEKEKDGDEYGSWVKEKAHVGCTIATRFVNRMNIHDIIADTLVLGGASTIGMLLKMTLKPTEAEAKLISRVLIGVGMAAVSVAKRWSAEHKDEVNATLSHMHILKDKMGKDKIIKG